jgi:hypothetical protein
MFSAGEQARQAGRGEDRPTITAEQRDQFYELNDELREVNAEAQAHANETEALEREYADHVREEQRAHGEHNRYDGQADQGFRQARETGRQLDASWNQLALLRDQNLQKAETAELLQQLAFMETNRWFTNWCLRTISETQANGDRIIAQIISIFLRDESAAMGSSYRPSHGPLQIGAVAAVESPPTEIYYGRYLPALREIEENNSRIIGQSEDLNRREAELEERAAEARDDASRAREFDRTRFREESLSADTRREMESRRQQMATYREQMRRLQADMDEIRQEAGVDPT